ncbi:MAG: LAGLIDADG family homing endonuclease [Candidatus Nanoarchaeia archaeon]|nr:LAGLIDADG family homing endonuclease [Candidatus Nanoarchaeia archaeon]
MNINLKDLIEGKFVFYLNNHYRNIIFSKTKVDYKDWRTVARKIGVNPRHLFGIRRGWELREGIKTNFMITSYTLLKLKNKLKLNFENIQKNITKMRIGYSGLESDVKFPIKISINEPINSFKRAIFEYIYSKKFKSNIQLNNLPNQFRKENNFVILEPENKNPLKIVPNKIIFNTRFAKEFGKWIGDRCGGARRIGVANKEIEFINDFKEFLKKDLEQENVKIILRCRYDFKPTKEILKNCDKLEFSRTQYGNYAYAVGIPHRELKELVFDLFENYIFEVLYNSKKEVRLAFYTGLFEAEGSVDIRSKLLTISYGFNLKNKRQNKEYLTLLEKVVKMSYLLEKDGFKTRISRKIGDTDKSFTLKYDIIISCKNLQEVNFIKDSIVPFLNHKKKLTKLKELEANILAKTVKSEKTKEKVPKIESKEEIIQPELNIGLVGH